MEPSLSRRQPRRQRASACDAAPPFGPAGSPHWGGVRIYWDGRGFEFSSSLTYPDIMRPQHLFLALIIGIAPAPDADAVPVTIAACRTRDAYADAMVGTLQQLATSTDPRDAGQRSRL